ncbi:hypothetical protein H2508_06510 [Parahaliea sp. F7430]|uniref:Uncharacterized protein n=1 Tax=Sediminihaliea albiluteola TaxID=2758564 RepID=A0A7W2TVL4_9GAMM|nr:hypothetical protein [Sediminihaliea albiluteola]MBA6412764.1 hypothetical protein [Sediminihaliea albiluteola]
MLACQAINYEHPMVEFHPNKAKAKPSLDELPAISLEQRANLKSLELTLRKQWRMGQNIVLCWSSDERGLLLIWVPHYFLGNYCAQPSDSASENEQFIRRLISGTRRKKREELFAIASRLDVAPSFIRLPSALSEGPEVLAAVEELIKRYGLGYVESRAVLLFDIAEFSLFTPFEQASQLNSLSYSMNSAYTKLLSQGIRINFSRTTTGDGYYVWNRDVSESCCQDLFMFLLLVVADNAVAREVSVGNTVPVIRSAYHVGSHYELYQAEGVNPTVFSYIVGDVTIDLARMLEKAMRHQILVGDFRAAAYRESGGHEVLSTAQFVEHCNSRLALMRGIQLSGRTILGMHCDLTRQHDGIDHSVAQRIKITDKHGVQRLAYNLQLSIEFEEQSLELGIAEIDQSANSIEDCSIERLAPESLHSSDIACVE